MTKERELVFVVEENVDPIRAIYGGEVLQRSLGTGPLPQLPLSRVSRHSAYKSCRTNRTASIVHRPRLYLLSSTLRTTTMVAPKPFLDYIESHVPQFIDRLREAVAIPR